MPAFARGRLRAGQCVANERWRRQDDWRGRNRISKVPMLINKFVVGALGALASVSVLSVNAANPAAATMVDPCAPVLDGPKEPSSTAPRPAAPTDLRILRGTIASLLFEPDDEWVSGPRAEAEPAALMAETHPYFDSLSVRGDCWVAYHLRSQEQLDAISTTGVSERKLPVTYDATIDAALLRIYAPTSTDTQQKHLPISVGPGSMFLVWDFRFDGNFAYRGAGYLPRHKTWRLDAPDGGPWLAIKTDYQNAWNAGSGVAEFYLSAPSAKSLGPGSTRGESEIVLPRLNQFYIKPNTWTRAWFFMEDIGKSVSYVSMWIADPATGPVQLYERVAVVAALDGPAKFRLEYDSSMDQADNPVEMRSWNRNVVVLRNMPRSDLSSLLQRPR